MKNIFILLSAVILFAACNNEKTRPVDKEAEDIDRAIVLASSNKPMNDTLARYRREYGVDFMLCYSITTDKHRSLGFQVMQSKTEKHWPLKIGDGLHKIRNIQGIDIIFCSSNKDRERKYDVTIDSKTQELIKKGYLKTTGESPLICTPSIDLVFCTNDDTSFVILSPDFLWKEEVKARENNVPYIIESYYPECK